MFNAGAYAFIDGVQDFKKKTIETSVQHEGIQKALVSFVDSQTKYTKQAVDAGMATLTSLGLIFTSKDFYTEMTEQYKSLFPSALSKKSK